MKKFLTGTAIVIAIIIVAVAIYGVGLQNERVQNLTQNNLQLQKENNNQSSDIDDYIQQLITKEQEIEELKLKAQIDSYKYSKLEESFYGCIEEKDSWAEKYFAANKTIEELNQSIFDLKGDLKAKEAEIKRLESEGKGDSKENTDLKLEIVKLQAELQYRTEKIDEINNSLDFWMEEYQMLEKWTERLATDNVANDNTIDRLEIRNQRLEEKIEKLQNDLYGAEFEIEQLENIIAGLSVRCKIINSFWYTDEESRYIGTIYFNTLAPIYNVKVSYTDSYLFTSNVQDSEVELDYYNNLININFAKENPDEARIAVITIYYCDGRVEDLYTAIVMG